MVLLPRYLARPVRFDRFPAFDFFFAFPPGFFAAFFAAFFTAFFFAFGLGRLAGHSIVPRQFGAPQRQA